jgi:histidinol phosphatase-like enzyme (inositol monophosphatase family)
MENGEHMTSTNKSNYAGIVKDCQQWADEAAVLARKYFRQPTQVSFKADESPVTVIDQLIESELKKSISAKYPQDGILGEESGTEGATCDNLWVIDPIDGTRSFVSGNPLFGMLLAYVESNVPVAGIISMPMLSEVYSGGLGLPATCNAQPITASDQANIDDCTLYINEGEKLLAEHPQTLGRLLSAGKVKRFGYDCYPHALLAAGHIDAVIDYDLKPYDYLALSMVIQSAGGIITDWKGNKLDMHSKGDVVSAATPELHQSLLKLLNSE